jgi:hypothetical protein
MISKGFVAAIAVLIVTLPARGEDSTPENGDGRYTFNKVPDGFLRLDTQTGEVSLCSPRPVGWACLAAPEDRAALENEITRLRRENGRLKQDLLSRGLPLPPGIMPAPVIGDGGPTAEPPSPRNDDLDRVLALIRRMWRRLVEAIAPGQAQHKS